ncbi:recombinase family protein [Crassaminicella profunda]|uniref:recombinase family protein n=1 Tax=Crassaminicella profunda TaxID=1286698 RepID=UPI001CA6C916|nr:recombinase family protein [Crassaminicella profunda]QZY55444.1 recombinase family protein [Crassaminicella profunda]
MRCAVYVRVSTDMETQKTSIAHQKNYFEKYIEDRNWKLYKIYQDIESGRSIKNRDGLQALMEDSKKNDFDMVLTKSISRFARNTLEGLILIRDLKSKNIRFMTIEDGFDSEEYDEFMFTLLLSIAQKESEKMSERIKFGKLCRAKKGYYNGSNAPYGYKKIDKYNMVPAEDITEFVIRKIFSMYLEGKGLYKIAKELNNQGYPTPSQAAGKKNSASIWHQSTIRKILSNRFYVGDMIQNKKSQEMIIVRNTHKPIIDLVTFEEVQRRLKEKRKKVFKTSHLFSGILVCGECGSSMHYKKDKETYICGKLNKMGKKYCQGAYIKEEVLKKIVCRQLKKVIHENICKNKLLKEIQSEIKIKDEGVHIGKINKKINELERKKDRVVDLLIDEMIDQKIYLKKIKKIEGEIKINEEYMENIVKKFTNRKMAIENIIDGIFIMDTIDTLDLNKLVQKIKVFKNKEVLIEYTFQI